MKNKIGDNVVSEFCKLKRRILRSVPVACNKAGRRWNMPKTTSTGPKSLLEIFRGGSGSTLFAKHCPFKVQ
jgi:hypothetical protein